MDGCHNIYIRALLSIDNGFCTIVSDCTDFVFRLAIERCRLID